MSEIQRVKKVINWLIFMEFAENEREMLKTSQSETGVISVPINVWEVIKSQADSLKSKDRQIDELISMVNYPQTEDLWGFLRSSSKDLWVFGT